MSSVSDSAASAGSGRSFARRRMPSSAALRPTKISQAATSRGGPFCGHLDSAARHASWNASSAASRLPKYRSSAPTARGRAPRNATSIHPRSVTSGRLLGGGPGKVERDRPNLVGAARVGAAEIARDRQRLLQVRAVDDEEAEQLLLGLGE